MEISWDDVEREGSGELKRDGLESGVLEDAEEELILELGLCSSSLSLFLLVSEASKRSTCRVRVLPFSELSEFPCRQRVCSIGEVFSKVFREWKGRKEEVGGTIESSGRSVRRVVSAGNIMRGDAADGARCLDESVEMLENLIDGMVAVSADSPAFNDTGVVSVYDEVLRLVEVSVEIMDQEFETDCFCPSDVFGAMVCGPIRVQSPGLPALTDDNTNSNARTGI